ncbi:hypothetical protein E2320_019889, partial [Naja naja]
MVPGPVPQLSSSDLPAESLPSPPPPSPDLAKGPPPPFLGLLGSLHCWCGLASCFPTSPGSSGYAPLPAWPGQWVGRRPALEEHLYCAGAERYSGGVYVQQPWYFCPPHPSGTPLLRMFTYFILSPRTAATHILLLLGGKEERHGRSMLWLLLPASSFSREERKKGTAAACSSHHPHRCPHHLLSAFLCRQLLWSSPDHFVPIR